ncbi:hypothetical protein XELAEV_18003998mg [Xenopus laevis]|uniref:Tyr recombinase domain-containing protein n=1 Tax=Xenopus laevis TaxID=8355 RepID=A0A974BRT6_XENLA|nr:hypothetical protein XELAEV_18003998mg [Xenopus laevis]
MINKRMSALSYLFKLLNFKDVTKKFIVRQILRSYRKEQARKDRRRPISLSLLNKLFDQLRGVCFSGYEENLFKLAFSLAFYGAFRISELVSKNKIGRGGLFLEDIQCSENHLSIYLKFSKTDVFGKGKMITLNRIKESPTCPVRCLENFLKAKPDKSLTFLIHDDGQALSAFQFLAVLRNCLKNLGLNEKEYASHSF